MNRKAGAALGLALAVCPAACLADTLFDAIQMAYETNPTLRAQRAQLRVDDEGYVQARAGYGPQVSVTGQYGWQGARVPQTASPFAPATTTDYSAGTGSAQLIVTQPLYTGGAIKAQVQGAAATVLQSREALRQAEGDLLTKVITAYVDVRRDRENRHTIAMTVKQTVNQVEITGTTTPATHGKLACQLRFRPSRKCGPFFVTHVHPFDGTIAPE